MNISASRSVFACSWSPPICWRSSHGDRRNIDLASEFTAGPAKSPPGGEVSYSVAYSNLSVTAPMNAYLNVDFPVGAFVDDPNSCHVRRHTRQRSRPLRFRAHAKTFWSNSRARAILTGRSPRICRRIQPASSLSPWRCRWRR